MRSWCKIMMKWNVMKFARLRKWTTKNNAAIFRSRMNLMTHRHSRCIDPPIPPVTAVRCPRPRTGGAAPCAGCRWCSSTRSRARGTRGSTSASRPWCPGAPAQPLSTRGRFFWGVEVNPHPSSLSTAQAQQPLCPTQRKHPKTHFFLFHSSWEGDVPAGLSKPFPCDPLLDLKRKGGGG